MGSIFRSENGGTTWQEESSGTSLRLISVSCLDDGSCFAAGEQGAILGAAVWPEISVVHTISGSSSADGSQVMGTIQVENSGTTIAQELVVTNTLPSTLQSNGPMTVSWETESLTIDSPTWPSLLSGLNISLTAGSTLTMRFPLIIENPQKTVQTVESVIDVQASGLPTPLNTEATLTLAEYSLFSPIVAAASLDTCYGPYVDDFTADTSGWPSSDSGETTYGYSSGEYSIVHRQANQWSAVTRRDLWQNDLLLQLSGYQQTNRGIWGLLFGLNDNWSNFYTFEIQPDFQQWYIFGFDTTNKWTPVASGSGNFILPGQGKNNLLIQGANGKMYFYINNYLVYEMGEKPGYVGLTGGSLNDNTHLRYDDYLFHKRSCLIPWQSQLKDTEMFNLSTFFAQERDLLLQR